MAIDCRKCKINDKCEGFNFCPQFKLRELTKGDKVRLTLDSGAIYEGQVARFTRDKNEQADGLLLTGLCILSRDGGPKVCSKTDTSRQFKFVRVIAVKEIKE